LSRLLATSVTPTEFKPYQNGGSGAPSPRIGSGLRVGKPIGSNDQDGCFKLVWKSKNGLTDPCDHHCSAPVACRLCIGLVVARALVPLAVARDRQARQRHLVRAFWRLGHRGPLWQKALSCSPRVCGRVRPCPRLVEHDRTAGKWRVGSGRRSSAATPVFYNSLTTNATMTIVKMMRVAGDAVPTDWRLVVNGYLPEYAYDPGRAGYLGSPVATALSRTHRCKGARRRSFAEFLAGHSRRCPVTAGRVVNLRRSV